MAIREPYNPQRTNTSHTVLPYPYVGFVKNNVDVQSMGRLSVWIPEIGGDPTDSGSWIICSYCSPFAGASDINSISNYQGNAQTAQQSYGWVSVPPDINSQVMVVFVAGEISRAYWIGCIYQQYMNNMVPGIPVGPTTATPPAVSPVIEYNKQAITGTPESPLRPPFTPLTTGLSNEGLNTDTERGSDTTSMRRESPPLVYGYLTPRGNTIHVDDNSNGSNEFIRLRTRSGTQVLIHETTGYVYINSKAGNSWLEVSDSGINAYTSKSCSIRAQQDFNIRADRNIILDAGSNIYMQAGQQITLAAGSDIQAGAVNNLVLSAGKEGSLGAGTNILVNAAGDLRLQSTSDTSSLAGGNWLRQAATIKDNPGNVPGAPAPSAQTPAPQPLSDTTQTYPNGMNAPPTWTPSGTTINTIVSVMPTHEPWRGHPNAFIPPAPASGSLVQFGGAYDAPNPFNPSNPVAPAAPAQPASPTTSLTNGSCSFGVARTNPITTPVYSAISNAATQTGANAAAMFAFADMESSFNASAQARTSSAAGLFQFINSTWTSMIANYGAQYNVPSGASVLDANYNAMMGGAFLQNNAAILIKAGISAPTPGQLYIMHFLGSNGGPKFIAANQNTPDAPAASLFPGPAAANRTIFYNSDGSPKTVSAVYTRLTSIPDEKAEAYSSQFGLPAPCQRTSTATT